MSTQGTELSFYNISAYYLPRKMFFQSKQINDIDDEPKYVLKNVNGHASSDQLLAIMGASGVGKSTLLNILTARKVADCVVSGDIRINGRSIPNCELMNLSVSVQQRSLLPSRMTVREHLIFSAILTLDQRMAFKDKMLRVDYIISELGLSKCADTMIGNQGTVGSISGGERKRLSLASVLLANPPFLFCDEPTSGLDSFMAQNVVSALRSVADNGKIVVATFHQPSSEVFAMFDRIMLMAEGRVAFLGNQIEALEFFKKEGFECPKNHNPADYYIKTLAVNPGNKVAKREIIKNICDQHEKATKEQILEMSHIQARDCNLYEIDALIIGVLFFGQIINQESVMNINGCLGYLLIEQSFQNIHLALYGAGPELPKVYAEHEKKLYKIGSYSSARAISELPIVVLSAVAHTTTIYWMVGLKPEFMKFAYTCGISILVSCIACSVGNLISICFSKIALAMAVVGASMDLIMQFSGFYLNAKTIPIWLSWLQYFSWMKFSFEALVINQWGSINHIDCNVSYNQTCYSNGAEVIERYNFNSNNLRWNMIILLGHLFAYRLLAYLVLVANVKARSSST